MIKLLARFLRVLNSESEPSQISLALGFALIAGLTPLYSPHNIIVLLLVLILKVNLSAFILGMIAFTGASYALDPLFHITGLFLLTLNHLEGVWTILYNLSVFRLERFYNSVVLGSLFTSLILFYPLYTVSNRAIVKYRERVLAWIIKSRIMQIIRMNKLYRAYQSLSGLGEDL